MTSRAIVHGTIAADFLRKAETPVAEETRKLQRLLPGGLDLAALVRYRAPAALPSAMTARAFAARPGATTDSRLRVARVAAALLSADEGALKLDNAADYARLARRADVPGAPQVQEMKFLMTGVDTDKPTLYLINTKSFDYHYVFYTDALDKQISLEDFNAQTYFRDRRKNVAGSLVLHESYQAGGAKKGLYAMEFWPTDPVKAPHVAKVYEALKKAMPWAVGQIAYHPTGNTQEGLYAKEQAALKQLGVRSVLSKELFKNLSYAPMNMGEGYGVLRSIDPAHPDPRPPTVRDVVIFESTPNDLSHVAGIITQNPQTPLSHINLKAKQNNTPNAYLKDAKNDPRIKPLIGELVYYKVGPNGLEMRKAEQAEADAWLEKMRPQRSESEQPKRNLRIRHVTSLDDIRFGQATTFGAKAANLAELRRILPPGVPPDYGFGVPFYFYDRFMKETGLYDEVRRMMASADFKNDPQVRKQQLEELQKKIKKAEMPKALADELKKIQAAFAKHYGEAVPIRCRSSTNNEDLVGFNGAGLYDSYTHRADEGALDKTVKQVYASLWNFRAFEEREFNRIDHLRAAMGVLLHKNEDDEQANGVAYTKNIYNPDFPGFYVNAQLGENLVTNPGEAATPDEFLIARLGEHGEYETQYISHSNQLPRGRESVLTPAQTDKLVSGMEVIQAHFARLYKKSEDKKFAMDIEFKIRTNGTLQIKQARPTVD